MNTWSSVTPSNTSLAKEFYSEIRAHQTNVRDRMVLDHYMQSAIDSADPACDGYHKQLTMKSSTTPQALSEASTTNVIPVTSALELVQTNKNYSTPITYGAVLNYDLTKKYASDSMSYYGASNREIALIGYSPSYNYDINYVFENPTWCKISMTPQINIGADYYFYVGYLGANIHIHAEITTYPMVIVAGISLPVKPYMLLEGACTFRQKFVETNWSDIPGASVTDDRRLLTGVAFSIEYEAI